MTVVTHASSEIKKALEEYGPVVIELIKRSGRTRARGGKLRPTVSLDAHGDTVWCVEYPFDPYEMDGLGCGTTPLEAIRQSIAGLEDELADA